MATFDTLARRGDYPVSYLWTDPLPLDAAGVFYFPLPKASRIRRLTSRVSGATLAAGSPTITAALDTTDITGGVLTLASGSTVGTEDEAVPTALNDAIEGEALRLTVAENSQSATAFARVLVELEVVPPRRSEDV